MISREKIATSKRWVIKIGSALLTADGKGISHGVLAGWVEQMAALRHAGHEILLVSSGAVAEGMSRMGWSNRPHNLNELQAAAAIGQMGLVHAWEACFQKYGLHTAQILLTRNDLDDRSRYLNARSTLRTLLELGVVPVVNENDTVTTDELRFGDNDTLAALVANLIEADLLVLLTDQEGLFDADPRFNPSASLIHETRVDNPQLDTVAGGSVGGLGLGGMVTKVRAARLAARSGTGTVIASGLRNRVVEAISRGETVGTLLVPVQEPQAARKRWLAGQLQPRGSLVLDDGAVRVLREQGSSLLAVGVSRVNGDFARGEVVVCLDRAGSEVARGLVNYNAQETLRIMGKPSHRIEELLGYVDEDELIHRDNLVLL
ncbi:MAG: glutamate 5-kinase [Candidatus Thiodiazotropha endolucinida]|uniref:Glutamate 5-kinase n=2 Tax=Candidatus Thiodiazotropha TaxID=1913444 RepID=A0A7Z1AFK1_9GAMM|nr:glutamate 5-kinase [Candidatus Thiodiazotropha endolucinida]MBT3030862.1 glutamate 5-kinase [Candidatus Thiodiazotropha sp. (ex Lucina pensylvanica)]MBT3040184.1 glutamate 5-kinase [Candidatus Thiodiazotropha sp. (ex Codakia orbicularis)]MBV2125956.1 glutamate 5-kinase [Candidatus Thiodiazotropha taylori]MBT3042742.1 glutamate 5-kinase [Candidatus Thiodiazotropha sp. (ex Codakia orbicularis)]MBT3050597.1 glutamate 5-kinase [Candidatus Thiodiazotropha sp. (ex Codakia orbicularis)]